MLTKVKTNFFINFVSVKLVFKNNFDFVFQIDEISIKLHELDELDEFDRVSHTWTNKHTVGYLHGLLQVLPDLNHSCINSCYGSSFQA